MSRRSKAREVALQMLFQVDLNPDVRPQAVGEMIRDSLPDLDLREFAWQLFSGTMECRAALDRMIQQTATNWKLSRMAATDRNVLRLGAYELLHTDTPRGVVIDEAVELARTFGADQSPQFVNGILDRLVPRDAGEANTAGDANAQDDASAADETGAADDAGASS